jgi:hypothetical protein
MKSEERLIFEAILIGMVEIAFIIYMTIKILQQRDGRQE